MDNNIFKILKASIYGGELDLSGDCDYESIFSELQSQTVLTLTKLVLNQLPLSDELREKWERAINQQLAVNAKVAFEERKLCALLEAEGIEFAIVKGSAAAQYYPKPELRTKGDIDVLAGPEDHERILSILSANGYSVNRGVGDFEKHTNITRNGVEIELHKYFCEEEYNDVFFSAFKGIKSIGGIHMLPDLENGFSILLHIKQHILGGLGLRHVCDWMFFVDRFCTDGYFNSSFKPLTDRFGLTTLAVILTFMCQKYLGLRKEITWCSAADEALADQLMEFVLAKGNLGQKRTGTAGDVVDVLSNDFSPSQYFQYLQESGEKHWPLARKNRLAKKFAWAYQIGRHVKLGLKDNTLADVLTQKHQADERKKMFKELGI